MLSSKPSEIETCLSKCENGSPKPSTRRTEALFVWLPTSRLPTWKSAENHPTAYGERRVITTTFSCSFCLTASSPPSASGNKTWKDGSVVNWRRGEAPIGRTRGSHLSSTHSPKLLRISDRALLASTVEEKDTWL